MVKWHDGREHMPACCKRCFYDGRFRGDTAFCFPHSSHSGSLRCCLMRARSFQTTFDGQPGTWHFWATYWGRCCLYMSLSLPTSLWTVCRWWLYNLERWKNCRWGAIRISTCCGREGPVFLHMLLVLCFVREQDSRVTALLGASPWLPTMCLFHGIIANADSVEAFQTPWRSAWKWFRLPSQFQLFEGLFLGAPFVVCFSIWYPT